MPAKQLRNIEFFEISGLRLTRCDDSPSRIDVRRSSVGRRCRRRRRRSPSSSTLSFSSLLRGNKKRTRRTKKRTNKKQEGIRKKKSNVGKCRFFGHFGTLYALASWEVDKAFNKIITKKKIGDTKNLSEKYFSKKTKNMLLEKTRNLDVFRWSIFSLSVCRGCFHDKRARQKRTVGVTFLIYN